MSNNASCYICNNPLLPLYALPPNVYGAYTILNCADCELAAVYPTPGPDIIDAMYSEAPPESSVGREVFSSKILTVLKRHLIIEPLLQKLSSYTITDRPALLDIGCASGWIASVARRIGFDTIGLELNRMLAEYGRESYDLKIIECSIEDFKTSQHFDAVTMFHVLEHVPEPVKALEHIRSFMSNNGVLLIVIPNTKSLGARLFKEKYNWNAPHHVSFFSPKSIVSVLNKTGFEVLSVDHLLSPPLLLYSFNNWSRFKIHNPFLGNAIFTPITLIGKLLSMGEVIAVYAKAT